MRIKLWVSILFKSLLTMFSLVTVLSVILIGAFILSGIYWWQNSEASDVSVIEKSLIADINLLVAANPDNESIQKTVYTNQSTEIYYQHFDETGKTPYLNISINQEVDDYQADSVYHGLLLSSYLGFKSSDGIKLEAKKGVLRWGDQCEYATLTKDESPIGHFFLARKGKLVYNFLITGYAFSDPSELSAFLTPSLNRLEIAEETNLLQRIAAYDQSSKRVAVAAN